MNLPTFKYHPDPVATGCIQPSDTICVACKQARGFIYTGPVYSDEDLDDLLCPWCIADGTACEKFDASFADPEGVGGYGLWQAISHEIVDEVAYRTPCFQGWQQERWFTHCDDAGEFLAIAGRKELEAFGEEAIVAIQKESGMTGLDWEDYLQMLDKDSGPTAYIFRCRHCGKLEGYSDCD